MSPDPPVTLTTDFKPSGDDLKREQGVVEEEVGVKVCVEGVVV